jgi:putative tricarboxylic transport membrane protein
VLLGGIWLHGIRPGPLIFIESPQFFYDYVGMQIISNIMILVFGLAISNVLIKVLLVKKDILMPVVATLCVVGAFAVNNSVFDVYLMLIFGLVGYLLRNHGYPMAPYTLGLILGTMADENLRRGLDLTKGDIAPFFFRPMTAILWLIILAMVVARSPYLMGLLRRLLGRQKAKTA